MAQEQEARVDMGEVSGQIARIFFPGGSDSSYTSGGRPSYSAPGYSPPQSSAPGGPCYPSPVYYRGYEDDIHLLIKLGQAALIIFIIFAVVSMVFMLTSCCLALVRRKEKPPPAPAPLLLGAGFPRGEAKEAGGPGGLQRSRGAENLALAETGSSSDSLGEEELGGRRGRGRSRSRAGGREEADAGPRFLGPQGEGGGATSPRPHPQGGGATSPHGGATRATSPEGPLLHPPTVLQPRPSNDSTASDISNNRSLPYYEVPSRMPGPFTTFSPPLPNSPPPVFGQPTRSASRLI